MRKALTVILLLPVLALITAGHDGCRPDGDSEMVIDEKICVTFDEYRTSVPFASEIVCPQFNEKILEALEHNGLTPEDVVSIHIVKGSYKVQKLKKKQKDWTIKAAVSVDRYDGGSHTEGPAPLVPYTEQRLLKAKGHGVNVDLEPEGVALLEQAAYDFINGADPEVHVTLESQAVTPEPTEDMPLEFKWRACVKMQIVANVDLTGNDDDDDHGGHKGKGKKGRGDDDDDD